MENWLARKIFRHKNVRTTMHHANILGRKMSKDMNCSVSIFKRKDIGQEKDVSNIYKDSRQMYLNPYHARDHRFNTGILLKRFTTW
jgi:hypothetical protein